MQDESIWLEIQTLRESHEIISAHNSGNGVASTASLVAGAVARARALLAIQRVRNAYEDAAALEAVISESGIS